MHSWKISRLSGPLFLVVIVLSVIPDSTSAQMDPSRVGVRAAELSALAARQYEEGDVAEAIRLYHQALELSSDPAFAFNLGQLYDSVDNLHQAHRLYSEYVVLAPDAANRETVETRIGNLHSMLVFASGRLEITTQPSGAVVTIQAAGRVEQFGTSPIDVFVPPGDLVIAASLEGYRPAVRRISIAAGNRMELELGLLLRIEPNPTETGSSEPVTGSQTSD